MNQRLIDYLNGQTDIWMAQATPGERKELEGLWSDRVRLTRHLTLYLQDPHCVDLPGRKTTLFHLYRWARDREYIAKKMHARRNGLTLPRKTALSAMSVVSESPVLSAVPVVPSLQPLLPKSKRGRKTKPFDDLLTWIYGREFKNPKRVAVRQLAKIIAKHVAMTGGNLSSTTSSRVERALKGAKVGWRRSENDWIAKVTNK